MGFLDINAITKSFGTVQVLHETNISVDEGEFLVLVGPSGCGKSTLLNMIAGLESVTSGEIAIRGRRMNEVRPAERNIAMVFQSYALYPNMNVAKNISFGLEMHGVAKDEREKLVGEVAELLQITQLLDRKPGQLSGGQRQRCSPDHRRSPWGFQAVEHGRCTSPQSVWTRSALQSGHGSHKLS